MPKVADLRKQGRSWLIAGGFVVIGVIIGQALPPRAVLPTTQAGLVTQVSTAKNGSGIGFVLTPKTGAKQSYHIGQPTPWQDKPNGAWHPGGQPSCLHVSAARPQKVTIGYVTVAALGMAPGGTIVVWVECGG